MKQATILLNTYYEALYGLLSSNKAALAEKIKVFLNKELKNLAPAGFDDEKFSAYLDAALAFLEERLEMCNPIGLQYTFERTSTKLAYQLELQLNFYDSSAEFAELKLAAEEKAFLDMTDSDLKTAATELITERGAFPDKSIIKAYLAAPELNKLPDYILAMAIENSIKTK